MAKTRPGLARICPADAVSYFLYNLFQAVANWIMARISQRALKNLRRDLFEHLQSLSIGFFDTHTAGELMSRLTNDIDAINQAVSQNVTSLVASVLSLVGIVIAMFVLNHWLALATLIVVPIMYWFTNFIATYTRKGFRELQKQLGGMNSVMEEADQRAEGGQGFPPQRVGHRAFREQNQAVYKAACMPTPMP